MSNLDFPATDPIIEFQKAMSGAGIVISDFIDADGMLHRAHVEGDKSGSRNGWYVMYLNGVPSGSFGTWKDQIAHNWSAIKACNMNPQQRQQHKRRVEAMREARGKERQIVQTEAAALSASIWEAASSNVQIEHPYLLTQNVKAFHIRQTQQALIIPIRNIDGEIRSLQFIQSDGSKRFKAGGEIQGCFCLLGEPKDSLYICEGWATGATIHELTGQAVAVALNAGNLKSVGIAIKEKYTDLKLIIAADNDHHKTSNAGMEKGREAASIIEARFCYPEFSPNEPGTDFNDFMRLKGRESALEALKNTESCDVHEDIIINELAQMAPLDYERGRKEAAEKLGIDRISVLDKLVAINRKPPVDNDADELKNGVLPWNIPVSGLELADLALAIIKRYSILPYGAAEAMALWCLGTYCFDNFRIFPRMCLSSSDKRCGKTTTMSVMAALVNRQLMASNVTPSVIFRSIDAWQPTLLIDEGDTFISGNEEMRGIVNSGHNRIGAFVLRTEGEGKTREPVKFSTWAPLAIAMIKTPPDTIVDRSIMIRLRRKLPAEKVHRLPLDVISNNMEFRQKALRWAEDNAESLKHATPDIPKVGSDRAEDNWLSLLAIAECIGGDWPANGRTAMKALEKHNATEEDGASMILADIRDIFEHQRAHMMTSEDLINALNNLEDRPWCEWRKGMPLSKNGLARLLKPFDISPTGNRFSKGLTARGYKLEQFIDTFNRYLPSPAQTDTTSQASGTNGSSVTDSVTVADAAKSTVTPQPAPLKDCDGVTLETDNNHVEA